MRHNRGRSSAGDCAARTRDIRRPAPHWPSVAAAIVILATSHTACFFRKAKVAEPQARPPARIVLLPMNVAAENTELRWLALAVPVLVAQTIENSPELEVVPLWESMPVVKESLGESRTITPENAEYLGSRLTARWATQGEITADKDGISILLDFIPAKPTLVPFRYEKAGPVASLGAYVSEALEQFLRYLVAPERERKRLDANSIRPVAEAIDREYGWFVDAQPGKAESVVGGFAKTDGHAAGLLFNPHLYPAIETRPAGATPAPQNRPPAAAPVPAAPVPTPPAGSPPAASQPEQKPDVVAHDAPQRLADESAVPVAAASQPPDVTPAASVVQRINSPPGPADPAPEPPAPSPEQVPASPPAMHVSPPSTTKSRRTPLPTGLMGCQIQVFASRSKSEAEAFSARLTRAGLQPELQEADLKEKGVWFRVRLQGYGSRRAAAAAAERLRANELIKDYWIVR